MIFFPRRRQITNLSIISLPWPFFLDHYFLSFQLIPSVIPILSKFYACTPEAEHGWRKMYNRIDCSYFKFRAKNLKVDPEFCFAIIQHSPGLLSLHSSVRLSHLFFSQFLNTSPVAFPFSWHPCFLLYWESWSVQRRTSSDSSTILTNLPTPVTKSSGSNWYMNWLCPWLKPVLPWVLQTSAPLI